MIIRIQSRSGTKRIDVSEQETTAIVYEKVAKCYGLDVGTFHLMLSRDSGPELKSSSRTTLFSQNISNGHMFFLVEFGRAEMEERKEVEIKGNDVIVVEEDEVDVLLSKEDGTIKRNRDTQLCRHGLNAKCVHCLPIEPFDESYLKSRDPPIKHLSFHSYVRKITSGVDKGKYAFLESSSGTGKIRGRESQDEWKEMASTITLKRQIYRHVDNILFEHPNIVDRFLNYWRKSGKQRIGYLYGRYEVHRDVPLGIKAVVSAIYEPPQASTANSVELLVDEKGEVADKIAAHLKMKKVGWIFTDLEPRREDRTLVKYKRNGESYFLTAEECIMAGDFQLQHPNACHLAPSGTFGSKFVTVIVTGNESGQIHFEGYQVSNQCANLVQDDYLVPTLDAPELGYIRESTSERYIPDVLYKEKEGYKVARPLPIEYLIIDIPAAFPQDPQPLLPGSSTEPFVVENRSDVGDVQSFEQFASCMHKQPRDQFMTTMADFHVLLFLATCETIDIIQPLVRHLCEAIYQKDAVAVMQWKESQEWKTVEVLVEHYNLTGRGPPSAYPIAAIAENQGAVKGNWACAACTFINKPQDSNCQMCDSRRS
ncbi:nuclear protein localization protein 4 homolog [Oscarella lobularis]|uniref:nuclear protein localization protein 4 homolog n=1 Tax=Oscarella lobularis TaxID=121494 RepID=UPI003314410F